MGTAVVVGSGPNGLAAAVRLAHHGIVGSGFDDHGLVFHEPDGRWLHPGAVSGAVLRRVARYGISRLTLHGLRHTWATLTSSRPASTSRTSPERLGHASAKVTWDIYQHVTPTMQADAAETVARLIFGTDA